MNQQLLNQLQAIHDQLDAADGAARPIGHILIALATLTDIVEQIVKEREEEARA